MPKDDLIRFLRDADDLVRIITGKRIPNLVRRSFDLFGKEAEGVEKSLKPELGSPYAVLGVRPDAANIIIKASYKSLIRETEDPVKQKEIRDAYQQIAQLREW